MKRKILALALCLCAIISAFADTNYKVASTSRLNVRKEPSATGAVLGTFKSGEEITVLSIKNGWAKVEFGKTTGYVSTRYIQELPKKTKPADPAKKTTTPERKVEKPASPVKTTKPAVVVPHDDSEIPTPLTLGSCMPEGMNLYLAAQLGFGWSNFTWGAGSVNGTMSYSVDVAAQLYFDSPLSFIPRNWYSELAIGYDKKGAADFGMNYIHLAIKPFGYRLRVTPPVDIVFNAGINLAFPLNELSTSYNSWTADSQCGVVGGVRAEWQQFALGISAEYDFTEVASGANETLNNIAVLATLTYKFGKIGHKK